MSKFSKKHYIAIADTFNNNTSDLDVIRSLIHLFEDDNPSFNKDVFLKACGWEPAYYEAMYAEPDWDAIDAYIDGGPRPGGSVILINAR